MTTTTSAVKAFIAACDSQELTRQSVEEAVEGLVCSSDFRDLLLALINTEAFSKELGQEFATAGAIQGLSACRKLRSCLNTSLSNFFGLLSELLSAFDTEVGMTWATFADEVRQSPLGHEKLLQVLVNSGEGAFYQDLATQLVETDPHAIYPTSSYRQSKGYVVSTDDDQTVEAVMTSSTFTSIRVVENVLDPQQALLRDMYIAVGRCVCLIDQNVERFYGEQIEHYFSHHGITLDKLVYRAMEVDKGIHTVERMLGDFKRLGVSRNEPVLIIGGGVLTDTGGLACALYHRNTPYVMLSTSIVAGIDAGPSPRTCCDGFGYKNLFGAYHAPILSITDRAFFKTLKEGWLRHGIAEIIKMAIVKDKELFSSLEQAGPELITTRFGALDCQSEDEICVLSQKILGAAMRSYVEAEYDNLYETHQCRPHAYGHTWSPGFEIASGLLHGHAVAIGMGFGAYLSYRHDWISKEDFHRILRLISSFGLSLWNDVMLNRDLVWAAQEKIVQKRGGNLTAPLPKGEIGKCGYLNSLSHDDLILAISEYQAICTEYPRAGLGIDSLCSDVGLEDPSTIAHHVLSEAVPALTEEAEEILSSVTEVAI
ncbi:sedoheptulose 7-phosphate cyclase [Oscillatoria sp. CS-180]|uniref:sedoheptulose 7-phosphate cyclase n=1 Tax=Oscillatoria sp. CS-180 TaxID=3021720 RepID=UPI00232F3D0A|nr:sedoheptulose 7-phosphate cyclase [Oscillatoria sp. CS-180]MDB9524704.1 sedoheptulose 7-phosphate cyclase [Oscillatoria sp. CS-180]